MVIKLKISELNGFGLKKDLNAFLVRKRYHNKHKDGSGNFGFTIRFGQNGEYWYSLDGEYISNGDVVDLRFTDYNINSDDLVFRGGIDYKKMIEKIRKKVFIERL